MTIAHLLVGTGLSLLRLPMPAKLAVWTILALSLARLLRQQRRSRPAALNLLADGGLAMVDLQGGVTECRVQPDTTVMPWLVVLRYRTSGNADSLVLPVDALGSEGHRQLRTWLRWRASVDPA
ncbi:MAG: hypothetical protein HZC22_13060 [Rhodocyclales bacterium]|nr:hypothetical protein [Rhodocyclales bacterium]